MRENYFKKIMAGFMFILVIAGTALGISGCGTSGTAASGGEKVIKLGMGSAWKDLIPYNNSSGGYYSGVVLGLLYDRLFYLSDDGKVTPRGADSWEISQDRHSVTFHLNKDAKWSDGTPVTAQDYVFAAQFVTNKENPASMKSRYQILQGVDKSGNADGSAPVGAEAVDDYTLKYTCKAPIDESDTFSVFMYDYIALPKHLLENTAPADYLTNQMWNAPVTNGPLAFDSMVPGSQLVMKANKEYHMGAPSFDKFIIQVMAPSNMPSALIAGDIDIAYPTMSEDDIKSLEGTGGKLKIKRLSTATQPYMLLVNQRVYKDKRFRQAIDKAIDREGIAKMLQHAEPIETPIRKDTKFYDPSVTYTYSPDQAKALLQSLAADGAIDLSQPVVISTPPGIREKVANIIQQNLQAVGLNTKIQVMEAATMFSGFYNGTTAIGLVNRSALADPMYMKILLSNNPPYFSGVAEDTWDQYYNAYLNAATEDEKVSVVKDYQKKWLDEVPIIFYASTYKDYGYNPRLGDDIGVEDMDMGNLPVWKWKVQ